MFAYRSLTARWSHYWLRLVIRAQTTYRKLGLIIDSVGYVYLITVNETYTSKYDFKNDFNFKTTSHFQYEASTYIYHNQECNVGMVHYELLQNKIFACN